MLRLKGLRVTDVHTHIHTTHRFMSNDNVGTSAGSHLSWRACSPPRLWRVLGSVQTCRLVVAVGWQTQMALARRLTGRRPRRQTWPSSWTSSTCCQPHSSSTSSSLPARHNTLNKSARTSANGDPWKSGVVLLTHQQSIKLAYCLRQK